MLVLKVRADEIICIGDSQVKVVKREGQNYVIIYAPELPVFRIKMDDVTAVIKDMKRDTAGNK